MLGSVVQVHPQLPSLLIFQRFASLRDIWERKNVAVARIWWGLHGSQHFTASAAKDGKVQWDCETMRSYQSIAAHQRQSGSISGEGAVEHARHLLFNSRGGLYFH